MTPTALFARLFTGEAPEKQGDTPPPAAGPRSVAGSLFLISVLGLFLELMLIRWVGTEVRLFAYLQNTVLVVCFLGLGLGCLTCRQPVALSDLLRPLFLLVLLLALPLTRIALGKTSEMLGVFEDMVIWYAGATSSVGKSVLYVVLGLALTFLLMALICDIFVPIGRILGRLMDNHPRPIAAYSINVAGSLAGIWLFVLLSAFYQPPVTWAAVAAAMCLFFLAPPGRGRVVELLLLAGIVLGSWAAGQEVGVLEVVWSPYQKLAVEKTGKDRKPEESFWGELFTRETVSIHKENLGEYALRVNNVGYQWMFDLRPEFTARDPERYPEKMRGLSQYDVPALLHPAPHKALIVGSGSGNDVAGLLRQHVPEVVAVEIDPAIIRLGREYHPEQPYANPAVRVVNDDARSFFATTPEKFDLVVFGLLDSHTTTAMTNARLDHYVYTRESIRRARSLLADGGVMILSFAATHPFVADRMNRVVQEEFGDQTRAYLVPHSNYGTGGIMVVAGDLAAVDARLKAQPRLAELMGEWRVGTAELPGTAPMATDDWPYIYLERPRIPVLYFLLAGIVALLLWRTTRRLGVRGLWSGWGRSHWHFFFLGAAFLLLEVQNISKASVLLGNTWLVNAVIISGILVMILLANVLAAAFPRLPAGPVYALLVVTCLGLYATDIAQFGSLPYAAKVLVVGGLTSLPMLFSGLIFIRSFAVVPAKDAALGANLLGALVGGLLQSVTFVTGIQALLLIVTALYLAAAFTRPAGADAARELAPA